MQFRRKKSDWSAVGVLYFILAMCWLAELGCAGPMSATLNRVSKAACDVLSDMASETDSPYIEMAEKFLRSGDMHSARDQLLRYLTMVKYDPDVLSLIQFIESQIPPEAPKMIDPPNTVEQPAVPAADEFGIESDVDKVYPPAPIFD